MKLTVGTLMLILGVAVVLPAEQNRLKRPTAEELLNKVSAAEGDRIRELQEYSVLRRYSLTSKRSNKTSEMSVRMTYRQGHGKQFDVLQMTGAEGMQRKVLQKIVDGEADCSRKSEQMRFTSENYDVVIVGEQPCNGRQCYVVETQPKRKSKYLLQGRAWIDTVDYALVRIEGRPTENISFWVGKPYIIHEFAKVGGYWLASRNTSVSESRLLGTNELKIDYSNYQVGPGQVGERLASTAIHTKVKTEIE